MQTTRWNHYLSAVERSVENRLAEAMPGPQQRILRFRPQQGSCFSLTSLMRHMYSFQLEQSAARLKRILVHCFCYESAVFTKLFSLRSQFLARGLYCRADLDVGRWVPSSLPKRRQIFNTAILTVP